MHSEIEISTRDGATPRVGRKAILKGRSEPSKPAMPVRQGAPPPCAEDRVPHGLRVEPQERCDVTDGHELIEATRVMADLVRGAGASPRKRSEFLVC
jgi:hypothetical protein